MSKRVFILDNYDSFTYNLVQAVRQLGAHVDVARNDAITLQQLESLRPTHLIISPGPRTPAQSGLSVELARHFAGRLPLLGVCLGHQSLAAAFGGRVVRAGRLVHGKTSSIRHDGRGIYRGLPERFEAMRYHSLIVHDGCLPDCFEQTAWTEQGELMGIRHREFALEGVQFHPESYRTPEGPRLLENFLA